MEVREIIVPHDPSRGPVTAVRRMLVHSSIAELQQLGLFERYRTLIDSQVLASINELIGPGWMPLELALAHYTACDGLALETDQIFKAGMRAGEKIGDALLVAGTQAGNQADRSPWSVVQAFSRMGRRIHEGGSAQYVKTDENKLLVEHRGNSLFSIKYYRVAHGGFLRKAFASLGIELTDCRLGPYRREGAQIDVRVSWK